MSLKLRVMLLTGCSACGCRDSAISSRMVVADGSDPRLGSEPLPIAATAPELLSLALGHPCLGASVSAVFDHFKASCNGAGQTPKWNP